MQDQAAFQKIINEDIRCWRRRIGGNIHALRVARRVPLGRLSVSCGMSVETIDRLEMGKGVLALDHLARLSRGLGVTMAAFFAEPAAAPE